MAPAVRRSIGYFALFMCTGLDMSVIGPTLPALATQTGSTVGEMGLAFLIGAVGGVLGTLLSGWLFGWAPGRLVLGVAEMLSASLLVLVPQMHLFGVLMAVLIVKGVAVGVVSTGANTLLLWTHGGKAGPFLNALHFFFGLGAFLSPFLLGLLLTAGGAYWQAYVLLAVFDFIVGASVLLFLRPPAPLRTAHDDGTPSRAASRYLVAVVLAAMLFLFFYVSAEITFGGWIYTYAVTLNLADAASAAYLTSLFWFTFTIGRLVSIPVAIRLAPAQILAAAFSGVAVFLGLLIAFPASTAVLWIAVAGIGLTMAPIWPSGYTLAVQSIRLTAGVSAAILLGDSVGGMVMPGLTGLFMERAGAGAMTYLILASMAATVVAFLAILAILAFRMRRSELPAPIESQRASS
ncbi:MAG TPA: MFS transporter [Candidatus Limnocylindrales bacterium]